MEQPTDKVEQNILRLLFDSIHSYTKSNSIDNSISDTKIIRDTQSKLRNALRGAAQRCTCAKRTWGGICEVCQATNGELVVLRNFYRVIKKAKKHNMTPDKLQEFVENTSDRVIKAHKKGE